MEQTAPSLICKEIQEVSTLLWGPIVKADVFRRWAQGFHFSHDEPTALLQCEGGPCAVLAPVQAFILKTLLSEAADSSWQEADAEKCNKVLVKAVCNILQQAVEGFNTKYLIVDFDPKSQASDSLFVETNVGSTEAPAEGTLPNGEVPSEAQDDIHLIESSILLRQNVSPEEFHSCLRVVPLDSIQQVEEFYLTRIAKLQKTYGVLLLLYSVICSKGLEQIQDEMSDSSEPLIDIVHGYGSQSLINLMLTGRAVGHVWDNEQDVGGLKLRGLVKQSEVGFLALLEHLRYCEVGSFFKNPCYPVWVLGSETHLTVLFSRETNLVSPETASEVGRRVFRSFDPEGNNFIPAKLLQDVLSALDLVSEPEYVDIMKRRLDPEGLDIILLSAFMDEFYSEEKQTTPDTFTIFHYNGLPQSCPNGKVVYQEGNAVLLESNVQCVLESNPILTVLQTKWPNIEVQWRTGISPSLN